LWVILAIIPLVLLLIVIIRKQFVRMDESSMKRARFLRWLMLIGRTIIMLLLLLALASPYSTEEKQLPGDPRLTILVDDSASMILYDTTFVDSLKKSIEVQIPVTVRHFGTPEDSPIADTLLQYLGDKNLLLVSDGNNYAGKSLNDVMAMASAMNTTVSAINLETDVKEAAVTVVGASETVEGVEIPIMIGIDKVNIEKVPLKVTVDGQVVFDETTAQNEISITKRFPLGVHKITAEIASSDRFSQNNVYYKSVNAVKKPKVLFVTGDSSSLGTITGILYDSDQMSRLPQNLDSYLAVIVNNLPASGFSKDDVDRLSEYVGNGNGLVLFGGKGSFDYGDYKGSYLETLLPVTIGTGRRDSGDDVSVVILIDISGSTSDFYGGGKAVDVEKAIALDIIGQLRKDNLVGVIAFNNQPFIISNIALLSQNEAEVTDKIKRLQNGGSTFIDTGISAAAAMLAYVPGSRNIILISDGKTLNYYKALDAVTGARSLGIRTFSVDIGTSTDVAKLKEIANEGGGLYFKPGVAQSIKLLFGQEKNPKDLKPLMVDDDSHFITRGMNLSNASVYGFNQVVPKATGKVLVSTVFNDPILTVGRFGLGRIAVFSTDDGTYWAGDLLKSKNSKLISKAINWAIGNPSKNDAYNVAASDGVVAVPMQVIVKSVQLPQGDGFQLSKIGESLYSGSYTPTRPGFDKVLGREFAVNNPNEYLYIGLNPDLKNLVEETGGAMFSATDSAGIANRVKAASQVTKVVRNYYRFPLIAIALLMLIIEITIRRFMAYKKIYK